MQDTTFTVPLSTHIPANYLLGGNPVLDFYPILGGLEILPVALRYRNRDKLWPDGPLGSCADVTLLPFAGKKKVNCLYLIFLDIDTYWTPVCP